MIVDECGAVDGMIDKGTEELGKNLSQCRSVHNISYMS
jgi:hypothetical protein